MQTILADPELIKEFLEETTDLLENLDNDLVSLESDSQDADLINRIFRAIHTIKGTSSFLGFDQLVELGHAAEDVLSMVRNGEREVTPELMDVLLDSTDKLKILIQQIKDNDIKPIDISANLAELGKIKAGEVTTPAPEVTEEPDPEDQVDAEPTATDAEATAAPVQETPAEANPATKKRSKDKKDAFQEMDTSTIRVDVDRLDDLMNLVGELVLERNRLLQLNREFRVNQNISDYSEKVVETTEKIHFVTGELQLSVLKTRMVPVDRLFKKFPRMIRNISREMKKEVELLVSGGETELDKTVIDQLGDPLVHLLRNSVDHGLEPPDVRKANGKNPVGTVHLAARQEGNHIIISVKDDGWGINVEKVKKRAIERKMLTVSQLQAMSKQDILHLILEPGFRTAEKVRNISGRGVGMDVVKSNIRKLNGIIDLQSESGVGTEVILKLPLTLAVIQALMVEVSNDKFAIPLASVIETMRIKMNEIKMIDKREVIVHRDSVIPLFYIDRLFNIDQSEGEERGEFGYVVLIGIAEKRYGLVVDRLLGQEEVVIKSLGEYLGNVQGIAGGTITGDGRVRLIVDCGVITELV